MNFGRRGKKMPEQDEELTAFDAESAASEPPQNPTREDGVDKGEGDSRSAPANREEYEQLKAERDQLVDRLARLQAEFENARKRGERERAEYRDYAAGTVVEQFLPVLDNFELSLKAAGTKEQLRSGVELIVKQMEDILRQLQVHPVASVGEAFDPRVHEAMGSVERHDMPDQHVAEEIRRGYRLRDRLLRPALVRVTANPKQKSE
jgi:molecular chaperone GrpE